MHAQRSRIPVVFPLMDSISSYTECDHRAEESGIKNFKIHPRPLPHLLVH